MDFSLSFAHNPSTYDSNNLISLCVSHHYQSASFRDTERHVSFLGIEWFGCPTKSSPGPRAARHLGSGEATGWPFLFQISRAKRIARPTSTIFVGGKDVINDPIFPFETVCKWSQLTAQSKGTPSAFERNTSDGMLRTVLVMGATVTSPRYSKTESRVRIRTGLFLSGSVNLYQRISPCFIRHPKLAQFPKPKTHWQ